MSDPGSEAPASRTRQKSRTVTNPMIAWEERTALVKREVEAARTASDAKTIRLKALRLAKEALDGTTDEVVTAKPSPRSKTKSP